jgi:biopolymer transport protein ExbB/TolQ
MPAVIIIAAIPAYILYSKFVANKDFLRVNLKKLKKLSESDVIELE